MKNFSWTHIIEQLPDGGDITAPLHTPLFLRGHDVDAVEVDLWSGKRHESWRDVVDFVERREAPSIIANKRYALA